MTLFEKPIRVETHNVVPTPLEPVTRAEQGPLLHPLLANRRSPRSIGGEAIAAPVLERLLEAARWASSSMNAQPWAFVLARREDPLSHAPMADLLLHNNRLWAPGAPLLVTALAQVTNAEGKPRASALFDLGLAVAQLVTQATAEGLVVHQMGGFDRARAREVLAIPEGWDPVVMLAIGHAGAAEALPEGLRAGETAARTRKPIGEIAFEGRFGVALTGKPRV